MKERKMPPVHLRDLEQVRTLLMCDREREMMQ